MFSSKNEPRRNVLLYVFVSSCCQCQVLKNLPMLFAKTTFFQVRCFYILPFSFVYFYFVYCALLFVSLLAFTSVCKTKRFRWKLSAVDKTTFAVGTYMMLEKTGFSMKEPKKKINERKQLYQDAKNICPRKLFRTIGLIFAQSVQTRGFRFWSGNTIVAETTRGLWDWETLSGSERFLSHKTHAY